MMRHGAFSKIFKEKKCEFCGEPIGLFDNRKLEDGIMCSSCADKLSPWFKGRRHATMEQIRRQLAYREANKAKVAQFRSTRSYGQDTRILLDDKAGVFLVARTRKIKNENPDVLDLDDVISCTLDIKDNRIELRYETKDGHSESYKPPRYRHSYDFYINLTVDNPFYSEMQIKLNKEPVEVCDPESRNAVSRGIDRVFGARKANPVDSPLYRKYCDMGNKVCDALQKADKPVY